MSKLTIYKERGLDATMIPNRFIDDYIAGANDIQLKVYLYMTRMTGAGLSFGVSDMADKFNHSEKDILRALRFWEKSGLLSLDYDSDQNLKALHMLPIGERDESVKPRGEIVTFTPKLVTNNEPQIEEHKTVAKRGAAERRSYSAEELNAFGNDPDTSQIIFVAEQYIGSTLSRSDIDTLLFIHDELGFSADLIDFLIQYCVERGKKKFSYIEKVAIGWADENIVSVRQAKLRMTRYDKVVYGVMQALGKDNKPTEVELNYIKAWTKEMGFNIDVIKIACERTVLATDKNRFQYANAILKNWKERGIKNVKDVEALDQAHGEAANTSGRTQNKKNNFNDFSAQRKYDYNDLEKILVSN